MKWNPQNGKNKKLIDENGKMVPYAIEFNEETEEAKIYLTCKEGGVIFADGKPLILNVRIPGAKVVDKDI